MKYTRTNQKTLATILSVVVFAVPFIAVAQVGIPCGEDLNGDKIISGNNEECNFNDLIQLANNIIKFLIYKVAVPLTAIGFMFVGARLVINQDKEGEWTKAKEAFSNIAIGFFIMLGAYVLIKTGLFALLSDDQRTFMQFLFQ
ncbi:MAG: hypothetical protein Q7K40_02185 [bacterium]|nr:hypothetical protein [bacterium]